MSLFQSPRNLVGNGSGQDGSDSSAPHWIPGRPLRAPSKSTRRRLSSAGYLQPEPQSKTGPYGPSRAGIRKRVSDRSRFNEGRWFLTTSFGVTGKPLDAGQRAERQARLLLERYGILIKEWYRREQGLLPWYQLFQVLKRLEWRGEIRRGYFVSGLSGIQFALPAALELLEKINKNTSSEDGVPVLLSSLDPALPYGGGLDWGLTDPAGNPVKIVRSAFSHLVLVKGEAILVCENHFERLLPLRDLSESTWQSVIQLLRDYLKIPHPLRKQNRIEIHQINQRPAAEDPQANRLLDSGFEKDGDNLVLWAEV